MWLHGHKLLWRKGHNPIPLTTAGVHALHRQRSGTTYGGVIRECQWSGARRVSRAERNGMRAEERGAPSDGALIKC
jgi:hypothetical protein